MLWKQILIGSILSAALVPVAAAQTFGVGGSVGLANDVSKDFTLDGFKRSDINGWIDYRFEKNSLLRFTYGSMRTRQSQSEEVVTVPGGVFQVPEIKERVNYYTVGVSYLFSEGFFTSGLFGGIGGYGIRPDALSPDLSTYGDRRETVFGWHFGSEAIFRVYRNLSLVGRLTYHNVAAHPHRQFVNLNAGVVARF